MDNLWSASNPCYFCKKSIEADRLKVFGCAGALYEDEIRGLPGVRLNVNDPEETGGTPK